jgi:hypothetical protein
VLLKHWHVVSSICSLDTSLLLLLLLLILLLVAVAAWTTKLKHIPVKYVIVCKALTVKESAKELAKIGVVGTLDKVEAATVG